MPYYMRLLVKHILRVRKECTTPPVCISQESLRTKPLNSSTSLSEPRTTSSLTSPAIARASPRRRRSESSPLQARSSKRSTRDAKNSLKVDAHTPDQAMAQRSHPSQDQARNKTCLDRARSKVSRDKDHNKACNHNNNNSKACRDRDPSRPCPCRTFRDRAPNKTSAAPLHSPALTNPGNNNSSNHNNLHKHNNLWY